MDDYIEREALIDDFKHCGASKELVDAIVHRISLNEADDVAPVRHGRWVMSSDRPDTIICTCCDNAFDVWKADIKRHHYCPNCGARMDGAE